MIYEFWRLSGAGDNNLGLACTAEGLVLGRTSLIERRASHFIVREQGDIERLLAKAYQRKISADRLMPGLTIVASALNANDQCLARIAAVHLRIPDLPDRAARDAMESEDILIKSIDWNPELHPRTGVPPNPGWFAPTGGAGVESFSVRTAENVDPTRRSDASASAANDGWVRLSPAQGRIDELTDFIEWIANAKPEDEKAIRAEIKRYFIDVGDEGSAHALNAHLTVLLRPGITREDRQRILRLMDVYTRIDPGEWVHLRHWGAIGATIAAGGSSAIGNEARAGGVAAEPRAAETAISQGAVTSAAADALSPIWKYGWAKRGWEIDKLFRDGSLPPPFRTIDNFTNGVATSIKSIDLNATTYQDAARLTYRLDQYVEKTGEYEGGILLNTEVKLSDITERVINLVVPKGAMTQVQRATIEAVRNRALTAYRYAVKIIITPL